MTHVGEDGDEASQDSLPTEAQFIEKGDLERWVNESALASSSCNNSAVAVKEPGRMRDPWLFRLIRNDKSSGPLELHDLDSHPQYGDKAKCIGWGDGAATGFEASVSASNERRNVVYGPVPDALLPPFYLRYNIVRTLSGL